jgi:4-amino-4-deoxy-L-arabinose transferase-like glycosyltransferase
MIAEKSFKSNILELGKSIVWLDIFLLLVISGIFLLYNLGSFPLFVPDEGRYPEVAREMLMNGGWLHPRVLDVPFLDKPVLYYWIEALSMHIFGVTIWAIRLPIALFGMFGCVIAYVIAGSCFSRLAGWFAAIFLLLGPLYFGAAHYANMDLEFAVWFSASMGAFILGMKLRYIKFQRNTCMVFMYIFAALAFLTKGLMGLVFPILIIGLWVILLRRWLLVKYMHIILGIVIFLVIVLPWLFASQYANNYFFYYFFYYQQIGRFVGTHYNNPMHFWFYIPILIVGLFPGSLLSIASWPRIYKIWNYIGSCLDRKYINESECFQEQGVIAFLVIWFLALLIFFSVPHSKIVGYILPVMIPLSVLLGVYFTKFIGSAGFYIISFLNCILWVVLGFIVFNIQDYIGNAARKISDFNSFINILHFIGIVFIICAILNAILLVLRKRLITIFVWMVMIAIFDLSLVSLAPVFNNKTILPLVNAVRQDIGPDTIVVDLEDYHQDLPIYLNRNIYIVYQWKKVDVKTQDNWASDFVLGENMSANDSEYLLSPSDFEEMWANQVATGQKMVVFADKSVFDKWRQVLGGDIKVLAEDGKEVVFTN